MAIPTIGSILSFAPEVTGAQDIRPGVSSIGVPGKFVIAYNNQNTYDLMARIAIWDGTPNGFTFGASESSSYNFRNNSGTYVQTFPTSGSRYVASYVDANIGKPGLIMYEVTESTNTVRFISDTSTNCFTGYSDWDGWTLIDSTGRIGGFGFMYPAGPTVYICDTTSSINVLAPASHQPSASVDAYNRYQTLGLESDAFLAVELGNYEPHCQTYIVNYTASTNVVGTGPAFRLWNPVRTLSSQTNIVGLYAFNDNLICVAEPSGSPTIGSSGIWLNFLQRTGSGDTFSPIGNEVNVISTPNSYYDCMLVPLDTIRNTFGVVGYDGASVFYRKIQLYPGTYSASFLSNIGSSSIGTSYWNATELDSDGIAILFSQPNSQSLFSVKFNEVTINPTITSPTIIGVTQMIGITKIQFMN